MRKALAFIVLAVAAALILHWLAVQPTQHPREMFP
jgi:hypothetical protein